METTADTTTEAAEYWALKNAFSALSRSQCDTLFKMAVDVQTDCRRRFSDADVANSKAIIAAFNAKYPVE